MARVLEVPGRFFTGAQTLDPGPDGNAFPIDLDSSDGLSAVSNYGGSTNTDVGTVSCWILLDFSLSSTNNMFRARNNNTLVDGLRIRGHPTTAGALQISGQSNLSQVRFQIRTSALSTGSWHHIVASWDRGNSNYHFYVDDVDDLTLELEGTDGDIGWDVSGSGFDGNHFIFNATGSNWRGCFTQLWMTNTEYVDLSVTANRRNFISATGGAVNFGVDGSTPTGTAPLIYLHNPVASIGTNRGLGDTDFTVVGTLEACASSPPLG